MQGGELAAAARGLVGTRFILHGREPAHGLDCVGLVETALARCGHRVRLPNRYTLRGNNAARIEAAAAALPMLVEASHAQGAARPGDILALCPRPDLLHLAIASEPGQRLPAQIVHAHAGLGRVVEGPPPPAWQLIACWRLASRSARS
ncbi:hypothetical protein I5E68_17420 [Novosphingobium sp. YJ-S2-02]|uniref:NlpC/P60 domain-containing protein n=2 Tax=Novosphingobium aureum TaxID=2792964 RepID=A0A931MMU4_9SPHN|nr:hypothetical protein [Novosphingobium aureum]